MEFINADISMTLKFNQRYFTEDTVLLHQDIFLLTLSVVLPLHMTNCVAKNLQFIPFFQ